MKLSEARECYYSHSGNASSAARQIAFAGIAVVWVFNQPQTGQPVLIPDGLLLALLLLCVTLAFDLLQYTLSAMTWGFYHRFKEKQLKHNFHNDPVVEPPRELNWPGITMFWLKLATLALAYAVLSKHLLAVLTAGET